MRRRILSLALVLALVLAFVPAATAATNHNVSNADELFFAINHGAKSGDTITLTANINYQNVLSFTSIDLTVNLNGFNLNVTFASALGVDGGKVVIHGGNLNLTGDLEMTNTVWVANGADVTITGNINAKSHGVIAEGAKITINGNVTANEIGIRAIGGGTVIVNGNVTAVGVAVYDLDKAGTLTVNGTVIDKQNPAPPPPANPLDTASTWAREGLTASIAKGFVPSDLQNNYQSVITRAEFCRLAVQWVEFKTGKSIDTVMAERGVSRNPNAFTDTNDQNILAAFALGITSGIGNNQFNPNGSFTREQAAGMILNVGKVVGMTTTNIPQSGFADMGEVLPFCVDGVNFVRANGIMGGTGGNNFGPKIPYTREQSILTFNNIP
jgi:hypothetical protein